MVSLNSAEVNFIAYGWDEDNKAAMSLRCFVLRNHSWENEKMRIWEFENFSDVKKSSPFLHCLRPPFSEQKAKIPIQGSN